MMVLDGWRASTPTTNVGGFGDETRQHHAWLPYSLPVGPRTQFGFSCSPACRSARHPRGAEAACSCTRLQGRIYGGHWTALGPPWAHSHSAPGLSASFMVRLAGAFGHTVSDASLAYSNAADGHQVAAASVAKFIQTNTGAPCAPSGHSRHPPAPATPLAAYKSGRLRVPSYQRPHSSNFPGSTSHLSYPSDTMHFMRVLALGLCAAFAAALPSEGAIAEATCSGRSDHRFSSAYGGF
ncbi:hypothetical protein BOTBODRAFT_490153 [Botryobasidium botryosum FD-172 SS1]|uniref:Uncharacterized protein n=1 Tax=Botryobasidium botryosum (strain FD-172 SS1) TaxID=930990 RepID=A0A067M4T3_BOTB1|nr:hypothetical protein BOTBODRAFT_490153 [Botryobasidium botryosum FD-172 SS1]